MPLGFGLHPGGMFDNSPTFQRWVSCQKSLSPEGTAERLPRDSAVPSGLILLPSLLPNVETLGYCRKSLRDKDFATFYQSNPGGIGTKNPKLWRASGSVML